MSTHVVSDVDAALELLAGHIKRDDVVLVKASNADRLWRVAEALHGMVPGLKNTGGSVNDDSRRNVEGQ